MRAVTRARAAHDESRRADALRVAREEDLRDHAAHRLADHVHAVDGQGVQQQQCVRCHGLQRVHGLDVHADALLQGVGDLGGRGEVLQHRAQPAVAVVVAQRGVARGLHGGDHVIRPLCQLAPESADEEHHRLRGRVASQHVLHLDSLAVGVHHHAPRADLRGRHAAQRALCPAGAGTASDGSSWSFSSAVDCSAPAQRHGPREDSSLATSGHQLQLRAPAARRGSKI